ncbi:very short patch repair endonuclease [Agrobacterium radiobacter]|uniref:Very short patch repair endonuclease n=1 Tax=Agrobacterium tumefaciens str. B6 TaxID=1183423 RepID=A0A822V4Y6_AGRTU|nr:very short patch repair endonuclease [Agrobacterium tumefaciens]KWT86867.1 DNA glycosylase [Agrobacterium tumefaciens str. B6]MQB26429.1 DNA mismatch endonuclease Vsr [Agrobacterium tumefaciens]NTA06442.1 DNA mismatch endonuclease Vsr [Agrobacterium tumefaciens]NTA92883.1 DNA mismatch endonuclease Vsr [Agrobacterium tumefaciens]NTB14089.1 DNA mismatch endonuclease Vsr [Agrobacterium tumefaciens]
MADIVPAHVRSRMMSGIRGKDTKPELLVRKALHAAGFRYRLHERTLPGKPDMVFPKYSAVVFVHGCFWHGHDCHLFRMPSTRTEFWQAKISGNVARDVRATALLRETGWRVGTVWECALKGREKLPVDDIVAALAVWLRGETPELEIRGLAA